MNIDPDAARALTPHLQAGEQLEWATRPTEATFCRVRPRLLVLGLFWVMVAGAAFWGFGTVFLGEDLAGISLPARLVVFCVAASPFTAVAAFALGGHVWLFRRVRRRTAHGITNRRVVVLRPSMTWFGHPVTASIARGDVGTTKVTEEPETAVPALEIHDARGVEPPLVLVAPEDPAALAAMLNRDSPPAFGRPS